MQISPLSGGQRCFFLLSVLLCWPALFNGGPFLFSDTTSYIRGADALVAKATGRTSLWSDVIMASVARVDPAGAGASTGNGALATPLASSATDDAGSSSFAKNILVGRSIIYGLFLYLGVWLGSLAVPAVCQALLAGAAIVGAARHFADPAQERSVFNRLVLVAFLAASLSALPYFAGFLMPDVFAGLAILAATIMLTGWAREAMIWRIFWFSLVCIAALVHTSHILILGGLGVAGAVLHMIRATGIRLIPVALILCASAVGVAGDMTFERGIHAVLHRATVRPPFLAMRLIADGPGAAYLRVTCPASGYALCASRSLPSAKSDVLLWSADPTLGRFTAVNAPQQRQIAAEQVKFALAVARFYPEWTASTALRNLGVQLGSLGLQEFGMPVLADPEVAARVPRPLREAIAASPAERGGLPTGLYRLSIWPITLAGLLVLFWAAWQNGWRSGAPVVVIVLGVALNAAVCGMLSTPTDRYQDRVIWLLGVMPVFFAGRAIGAQPQGERTRR